MAAKSKIFSTFRNGLVNEFGFRKRRHFRKILKVKIFMLPVIFFQVGLVIFEKNLVLIKL